MTLEKRRIKVNNEPRTGLDIKKPIPIKAHTTTKRESNKLFILLLKYEPSIVITKAISVFNIFTFLNKKSLRWSYVVGLCNVHQLELDYPKNHMDILKMYRLSCTISCHTEVVK